MLLQEIDLFAEIEPPSEIAAVSANRWLRTPDGYVLDCGPHRLASLIADRGEGTWRMRVTVGPGDVRESAPTPAPLERVVRSADAIIARHWPEAARFAGASQAWLTRPASPKQIGRLRRMGVPEGVLHGITASQASGMISRRSVSLPAQENRRGSPAGAGK